jgi:hypothetical protein
VSTLHTPIRRGSEIEILLECPQLQIDSPTHVVVWRGIEERCAFLAKIPQSTNAESVFPIVVVSINGVPVGRIRFRLQHAAHNREHPHTNIGATNQGKLQRATAAQATLYRRAFVSYCNKDVGDVIRIVQGLRAGNPNLEFFQDIDTLRPGEVWRDEILDFIRRSDLFLLIWSSAARASKEVSTEIACALLQQKNSPLEHPDIMPIPIEGPPLPEPPEDLKGKLNFRDRLQWIKTAEDGARMSQERKD